MSTGAVNLSAVMDRDNIELPEGSVRLLSRGLLTVGAAAIALTILAAVMGDAGVASVAQHAFHVGVLAAIGFSLGSLGVVMILHQTNAGWASTIRRQFENVMSLIWVGGLLFIADVLLQVVLSGSKGVYLWDWMNQVAVEGDPLYAHKSGFLNVPFFAIRCVLYFATWLLLSQALWGFSTRQDADGDKWHTAKARKLSAPGLLLFALTTAFAGFDWAMTLDYHWFSTMYGVYFFAGNMVSCLALTTLVLILLRSFGRLHVAFTVEHLHDLSKFIFAFTVFWAYISFSQYFLIWYANIPEETAWMLRRKTGDWEWLSWVLPIGHFIIPFLLLIPRPNRRNFVLVGFMCLWLIALHILDVYWAVRPEARAPGVSAVIGPRWIDLIGVAGPVLVFLGFLVRKVADGPLIPIKDPRLMEGLRHKNYV